MRRPSRWPSPVRSTVARSWPRCRRAWPFTPQRSSVPATPRSASPAMVVAPSALRQRSPRAFTASLTAVFAGSARSATPFAVIRPSYRSSTSGCNCRRRSSSASREGCRVVANSPCRSVPCTVARPPSPSATRSKAIGVAGSPPLSRPGSTASLAARRRQRGASLSPRRVRVARVGAGRRPAMATSIRDRSPLATSPRRGAVRPAGAGSTAVATRSVR